MINELALWCLTPCPAYARHMGYLYQSIALRSRDLRHSRDWQSHLQQTKSFILKTAASCNNHDKVIILGSGLLLDVPLDELASLFREVVLVDVVHLPEVKRRIKKYGQVILIQADITGIAEPLYHHRKDWRCGPPESRPLIPEFDEKTGLVISLNLLSQLALVPTDYLRKRNPACTEHELEAWGDRIRRAHIDALTSLKCPVCLISDYQVIYRDRSGNIAEKGSTIGSLSLPVPHQVWTWQIAPRGEERRDGSKELIVGAWQGL